MAEGPPPNPEQPAAPSNGGRLPGFGIKALTKLTIKAIEETPGPLKGVMFLAGAGTVLAVVLAGIFALNGEATYGFVSGLAAFAFSWRR